MPTVADVIVHCQKQIKKDPPEEKLLHYLSRLDRLRITVQDLASTGVGRTVNQLSRLDNVVGHEARKLVRKWKAMVSDENSEDSEDSQSSSSGDERNDEDDSEENARNRHGSRHHVNGHSSVKSTTPELSHHMDAGKHRQEDDGMESDSSDRLCIAAEDREEEEEEDEDEDNPINDIIKQEANEFLPSESEGSDGDQDTSFKKEKFEYDSDYGPTETVIIPRSQPNEDQRKRDGRSHSDIGSQHRNIKRASPAHEERLSDDSDGEMVEISGSSHKKDRRDGHHKSRSDDHNINDKNSKQETKEDKRRKDKERNESDRHRHKERSHKHSSDDGKSSSSKDKHSKDHKSKKETRDRSSKSETKKSGENKDVKAKTEPEGFKNNASKSTNKDSREDKHSSKHKDKSKREESKSQSEKHKSGDSKDKHRSSKSSEERHKSEKEKEDRKRKGDSSSKHNSSSPDSKRPKLNEVKSRPDSAKPGNKSSISVIPDEIDSSSGVKFEELLGCLDSSVRKKKSSSSKKDGKEGSYSHTSVPSSSSSMFKDDKSKSSSKKHKDTEKEKKRQDKNLKSIIPPTLNISPNYKPSAAAALLARPMAMLPPKPQNSHVLDIGETGNYWEDSRVTLGNGSKDPNSEDALASILSSRNQRTKVFSGKQTGGLRGTVPKLYDLCMQVIQDNIQDLGYTGGVPYDILKPALERATSQQLLQIEDCNQYLIGDTDDLWKFHCSREFKERQRSELESWRELFERCMMEREQKFAIVRSKMLKKGEVAEPVRKAKLAYVEPVGGPRFNRQKAATIKNGMKTLKIKEEKGPKKGVGTSASVGFNNPVDGKGIVVEQAVIINPDSRAAAAGSRGGGGGWGGGGGGGGGGSTGGAEATARLKPRRAPLMAKTMKFIKTLQRR